MHLAGFLVALALVGCASSQPPPATLVSERPGVVIAPQTTRADDRSQFRSDDFVAAIPPGTALIAEGDYVHWVRDGVKRGWISEVRSHASTHGAALHERERFFAAALTLSHAPRVVDEERGTALWSRRVVSGKGRSRDRVLVGMRHRDDGIGVTAVIVRCFSVVPADECDAFANGVVLAPAFEQYDPTKLVNAPERRIFAAPTFAAPVRTRPAFPGRPTALPSTPPSTAQTANSPTPTPTPTTPTPPTPSPAAPAKSRSDDARTAITIYAQTPNDRRVEVLSPTCRKTTAGRTLIPFAIEAGKRLALAAFVHSDAGNVKATVILGSDQVPFDAPTKTAGVWMLFSTRTWSADYPAAVIQVQHASKQPQTVCFYAAEWIR